MANMMRVAYPLYRAAQLPVRALALKAALKISVYPCPSVALKKGGTTGNSSTGLDNEQPLPLSPGHRIITALI
jgi:hypothetical protein